MQMNVRAGRLQPEKITEKPTSGAREKLASHRIVPYSRERWARFEEFHFEGLKWGLKVVNIRGFVFFFDDFSCVGGSFLEKFEKIREGDFFTGKDSSFDFEGEGFLLFGKEIRGRVHRMISPELRGNGNWGISFS